MRDRGADATEQTIDELEERIVSLYREAYEQVEEKYKAFCARFERDDKTFSQQLKDGKITAATYRDWLRGQVFQRMRWRKTLEDLAETLTQTKQAAMDIVNEAAPGVFAMNADWATFEIEHAGNINMGFGLYSEDAVKRLLREQPNLLPPSRVAIPEDEKWNMQAITRQINVGIVTGEGLEGIAQRLRHVAQMSENQARTHARTAMTGAQNAGRVEGYRRAQAMGIEVHKQWLATLDRRTRHAHAELDGQHVPVDKPFNSRLGAIRYPGDPEAKPANVYNCRCTLIGHLVKYPAQDAMRRPNTQELGSMPPKPIKDMTYAEWAKWKKERTLEKPENAGIIKTDKQLGKKIGKHALDYGLDPSKEEDRQKMLDMIDDIFENREIVVTGGEWRGQNEPVKFYIKGEDVVVTTEDDRFITIMKGGINNERVKNARRRTI